MTPVATARLSESASLTIGMRARVSHISCGWTSSGRHTTSVSIFVVSWLKLSYRSTKVRSAQPIYQVRSNRTINLALTAGSSFYDYMRRVGEVREDLREQTTTYLPERARGYKGFLYGIAGDSPVEKNILKQPVPRKDRPQTICKEQVQTLMDACQNRRDRLLIWLLDETGMRIGEASCDQLHL